MISNRSSVENRKSNTKGPDSTPRGGWGPRSQGPCPARLFDHSHAQRPAAIPPYPPSSLAPRRPGQGGRGCPGRSAGCAVGTHPLMPGRDFFVVTSTQTYEAFVKMFRPAEACFLIGLSVARICLLFRQNRKSPASGFKNRYLRAVMMQMGSRG